MGTDLFIYHGYVALWLDDRLFKVTPAFNTELCERFGVRQLIFDGKSDALFHEFDTSSHRHMEYVNDRGWFADPPIGQLLQGFSHDLSEAVAVEHSIGCRSVTLHSAASDKASETNSAYFGPSAFPQGCLAY